MVLIPVFDNNVDAALAKLRNGLKKEGILADIKKHEYYRKPSLKKREKRKAATAKRITADREARKRALRAQRNS